MVRRHSIPVLFVALGLAGCASSANGPASPDSAGDHPIVVDEVRVTKTDPADLDKIFREASDKLLREEFKSAADDLERVVAVDPTGPTAAPALYNLGMAYLGLGDLPKAVDRFQKSAALAPDAPTTKMAWIRSERILAYLERWADLEKSARAVLARKDLSPLERIEGQGQLGLSLVFQGHVDEAYDVLVRARNEIDERSLATGISGPPPLEVAVVNFAMGEVKRIRSETVTFVPVPANFGAVLEDRCTGLLDAQSAYTDAMRTLDAHWSAMAGFRIGQLYQKLHQDVMKVPPPSVAKTVRQQQLWEGAMRLRYRVLLEKGLAMMAGTVSLGEKTGEVSTWVTRAREAKKDLETALEDEKAALAKLPFTEEEIRAALDDLKKKSPPPKTK